MSDSSSSSDLRPDLDESINVQDALSALKGDPAAGREKTVRENGMEAVSLWLVLISAIVVLAAGAVMGQGGSFFGYDELVKDGYMRRPSPVPQDAPKVPIAALALFQKVAGPIEVAGTQYNGNMSAFGANLNAKDLAALMTYIRTSWGNDASIVSPSMAANALEISKKRGGSQTSSEELKKSHDKMLPGDILAPDTLLDPETWEPIAADE
jgi:hypothetical protein